MPEKNQRNSGRNINGYLPARLVEGAKWYIEFYAIDPDENILKRKRCYVPKIQTRKERRRYALEMQENVNKKLREGWSPFFSRSNPKEYTLFADICKAYTGYAYRMASDNLMRRNTYNGYMSMLSKYLGWNGTRTKPVMYAYQFDSTVIGDFLEWLWIDEKLSPRTRDNYLTWFKVFGAWMVERRYLQCNPAESIKPLQGKRKCEKNRTVIPRESMVRLREHLMCVNRHYLLACYILYYCLIRPREMSYIRIADISVKNGTIAIHASEAKNGKDAAVTVPDTLMRFMIELHVLECPGDWYLFSLGFAPGKEYRLPKYFADGWKKYTGPLDFPDEYKFYSLKDTGITDMIREGNDLIAVRDQARHHSLQMTDLYTPMSSMTANPEIKTRKSYF